jgi:hypothetical protein
MLPPMMGCDMLTQQTLKELFVLTSDGRLLRKKPSGEIIEKLPSKDRDGYVINFIKGKIYREHRLIWMYVYGEMPNGMLDHINRVKSDNRIENLRVVSFSENRQNIGKLSNNKSGLKGIWFHKKNKNWCASICVDKKKYHIGSFITKEEAFAAYKDCAEKMHKFNHLQ